ncbi:unnamed protein product, partial [Symbiodinium necroappetens]
MLPSLRRCLRPCGARFAGYQPRRAGPPTVYHEAYSPEWPVTHRFPMWKFKDLAELLVEEGLLESFSDFVTPQDPPDEWFTLAHEEEYYRGFIDSTLDPVRWRRIGHAMLGSPFGFCLPDKRAERAARQLRSGTSQFNGVHWHKRGKKFGVQVRYDGKLIHVGYFLNETEAACEFDKTLRSICRDPVRLKKSLNFPTKEEASYEEPLSERRSRGLKKSSKNRAKDVESLQRLQHRFSKSPEASDFEIANVPSLSRVDALFRPRGAKSGGLPLQLKSSSCHNYSGEYYFYAFSNTKGYEGMLLVLVALDRDIIWMVPGSEVSQT